MSHMLNNYMSNDILSIKCGGTGLSYVDILGVNIYMFNYILFTRVVLDYPMLTS